MKSNQYNSSYLMESPLEGKRIISKTVDLQTIEHLDIAGLKAGMNTIDVGCASGKTTRIISKVIGQSSNVCGYDMSNERIEESKMVDLQSNITNINYACGSVYDMSQFGSDQFDFTWSRFLIEYLKDPVLAIKEMRRITKPSGVLAVADIDGNCLFHHPIANRLKEGLNKVLSIVGETGFDPYVGRKLYSYFIKAGYSPNNIAVSILPYHQIIGEPTTEVLNNWKSKMMILKKNIRKISPKESKNLDWVFEEYIEHLSSPDTITYSNLFIVKGKK